MGNTVAVQTRVTIGSRPGELKPHRLGLDESQRHEQGEVFHLDEGAYKRFSGYFDLVDAADPPAPKAVDPLKVTRAPGAMPGKPAQNPTAVRAPEPETAPKSVPVFKATSGTSGTSATVKGDAA